MEILRITQETVSSKTQVRIFTYNTGWQFYV